MKTNLKGDLASSLLAPALRARFSELFGVASRKSVFAWRESALQQAQVVVLDVSSNLMRLQPLPPCVIWVGSDQPSARFPDAWVSRLAQNYTLSDLIDILDRAAVFLLDWKARQPVAPMTVAVQAPVSSVIPPAGPARAFAHSTIQPAAPAAAGAAGMAAAQGSRYRLGAWVFLGAPFDSAGCISALALLARQPVTAQQLHTHSGLAPAELAELLKELARRKVLQVIAPAQPMPASAAAAAAAAPRGPAPVRKGFVLRLSHWLTGAGRP